MAGALVVAAVEVVVAIVRMVGVVVVFIFQSGVAQLLELLQPNLHSHFPEQPYDLHELDLLAHEDEHDCPSRSQPSTYWSVVAWSPSTLTNASSSVSYVQSQSQRFDDFAAHLQFLQ